MKKNLLSKYSLEIIILISFFTYFYLSLSKLGLFYYRFYDFGLAVNTISSISQGEIWRLFFGHVSLVYAPLSVIYLIINDSYIYSIFLLFLNNLIICFFIYKVSKKYSKNLVLSLLLIFSPQIWWVSNLGFNIEIFLLIIILNIIDALEENKFSSLCVNLFFMMLIKEVYIILSITSLSIYYFIYKEKTKTIFFIFTILILLFVIQYSLINYFSFNNQVTLYHLKNNLGLFDYKRKFLELIIFIAPLILFIKKIKIIDLISFPLVILMFFFGNSAIFAVYNHYLIFLIPSLFLIIFKGFHSLTHKKFFFLLLFLFHMSFTNSPIGIIGLVNKNDFFHIKESSYNNPGLKIFLKKYIPEDSYIMINNNIGIPELYGYKNLQSISRDFKYEYFKINYENLFSDNFKTVKNEDIDFIIYDDSKDFFVNDKILNDYEKKSFFEYLSKSFSIYANYKDLVILKSIN